MQIVFKLAKRLMSLTYKKGSEILKYNDIFFLPVNWKRARRLIIILLTGVWEKKELSYVLGRAVWQLSIKNYDPNNSSSKTLLYR